MKTRDKIIVVKYFLTIFNGISLIFGLMVFTFALWLLFDRNNLFTALSFTGENHLISYLCYMLLGTGSIIIFISFLGCIGSFKEIRCLLVLYMGLTVMVFSVQVAIPVLIYKFRKEARAMWSDRIDAVISNYGNKNLSQEEHAWHILNDVQHSGCEVYIKMWFENNTLFLIAVNIGLLVVQILLFVLAVCLSRNIKKKKICPQS
ncbi:PREDICTED: putative tetraspanin-19 isoform X2 [Crocodylus porosus]|uniref:putative tetraspanin-19 isoform X2 n=1 Tax=Crocodylus porosus TaxID=8502 RepID=UPI00093ED4D3|nr:PREDICTED: putative tetraspanin-19 isoform X2 [Crocodylus porosus]